jgi:hypothetical protein
MHVQPQLLLICDACHLLLLINVKVCSLLLLLLLLLLLQVLLLQQLLLQVLLLLLQQHCTAPLHSQPPAAPHAQH